MDIICVKCKAKKWKSENNSTCCNDGAVQLDPLPPLLQTLRTANTEEAKLFRDNFRRFNNALALPSLKAEVRKFSGYSPSVVLEGKVHILHGPLIQDDNNEQPRFAQIYIHDLSTQHRIRVDKKNQPKSVTQHQIKSITKTMKSLQNLMHEVNPFVKDFLHIWEIPGEPVRSKCAY